MRGGARGWIVNIDLFDAPEAIVGTLLLLWPQLIFFSHGHSPRTRTTRQNGDAQNKLTKRRKTLKTTKVERRRSSSAFREQFPAFSRADVETDMLSMTQLLSIILLRSWSFVDFVS